MNILIFTNSDGGLYLFRKELLEALVGAGHEVFISVPEGDYQKDLERLGCRVIPTELERRGKNPLKEFGLLKHYKKILKEVKPKLALTYTIKPNIYGGIACAAERVPYLSTITGLGTEIEHQGIRAKILLTLYRYALRKARRIFVQNASIDKVFEACKIADGRRTVIPGSGVNLAAHPYLDYPPETPPTRFLFIGRIMKDKGVGELLAAIEELSQTHKELFFDIVGEYEGESYRTQIESLAERGLLKAWGFQKEVNAFFKDAHALINPSYHEGISNVLLEAAACGRPVLASKVPGCIETFDDGVTGIGFEARSKDALLEATERFLALPYEKRKEMGELGRKKIENEFDRKLVIDAYLKEIEKILSE